MAPDRKPKAKGKISCPRCGSLETRYCGYSSRKSKNPKYRCKSCSRYWTHGGCRLVSKTRKRPTSIKRLEATPAASTNTTNLPKEEEGDCRQVGRFQIEEAEEEEDGGKKMARFLEWAGAMLDPQLRLDFDDGREGIEEQQQEVCVPEEFWEPFLRKGV